MRRGKAVQARAPITIGQLLPWLGVREDGGRHRDTLLAGYRLPTAADPRLYVTAMRGVQYRIRLGSFDAAERLTRKGWATVRRNARDGSLPWPPSLGSSPRRWRAAIEGARWIPGSE